MSEVSTPGPEKESEQVRLRMFSEWRESVHAKMERDLAERLKTNPKPTEEELMAGAFHEELEPQVRDAVFEMRRKGYDTVSSGFEGEYSEAQSIQGHFAMDEDTEKKLAQIGVQVRRQPGYTFLGFFPGGANLEEMKKVWDEIAKILPDLGRRADVTASGMAEEFIRRYAPDRSDLLRRIFERRWEHMRLDADAMTDKLGKPVDQGIREAVVALMAHQILTDGSCEGHGEPDREFPWADISAPEPEGWRESEEKKRIWMTENERVAHKVGELLEEFYGRRKVLPDTKLTMRPIGIYGAFRLESAGAGQEKDLEQAKLLAKLDLYKKEMDDFSEFLREKYFERIER